MQAEQDEQYAFRLEHDAFRSEQAPDQWSEAIPHARTLISFWHVRFIEL